MDNLRQYRNTATSLINGKEKPIAPNTRPNLNAQNTLRSEPAFISVSEQMEIVIKREFEKIRAVQNLKIR